MLSRLKINNVALISECDITLESGLNILSGETGAGKSIIIDSINFVLGARADKSLIRFGETQATVTAVFSQIGDNVKRVLTDLGLDEDDQVIIKRQMSVNGKSDIRVNGESVTQGMLKKLSTELLDIVGQHDNQLLLRSQNHIGLVDAFGGDQIRAMIKKCGALYSEYRELTDEIESFEDADSRNRKLDILEYQINEIDEVSPEEGEYEQLLEKRRKMNATERILTAISTAVGALNEDGGAINAVHTSKQEVSRIADMDQLLSDCSDRLENAEIELKDIAETLSDAVHEFEFSAYEQERVEKRIDKLRSVMRKYGGTVAEILEFRDRAEQERDRLRDADDRLNELNERAVKVSSDLFAACVELSKKRRKCAQQMSKLVENELKDLGMNGTTFSVSFSEMPEDISAAQLSSNGFDKVEFLLSPNLGAPLMSLSKIASGGEMNRILLAMKVVLSRLDDIGTVIFDEIDTGISGNVAQIVAGQMYKVSLNRQVIAVTHLAQLCAMSDHSFKIEKNMVDGTTKTYIHSLGDSEKTAEVSRLIGGTQLAESASVHAANMIEFCRLFKEKC